MNPFLPDLATLWNRGSAVYIYFNQGKTVFFYEYFEQMEALEHGKI